MSTPPGITAATSTQSYQILATDRGELRSPKKTLFDKTKSRDIRSSPTTILLPGQPVGKVTSGGKYASSIIGVTNGAHASGVTLAVSVATAVELVRRVGASGTFTLVGPPGAAGTVRSVTVTYSAVNVTTGDITITAIETAAADEVQTITFDAAMTAGVLAFTYFTPDGEPITDLTALCQDISDMIHERLD